MSCARNQILQMLVRLTGPPRPRVSAAALQLFSNLDRADHHGNHAVFQNRAGLSTAKADAAHPHGVPNGAPFFCNRREKAEHDRHGDCDLLRQVKPLHSGHEFAGRLWS